MLDLNHFKQYNDTHGHLAGDELLRQVATAWSLPLRRTDMLARYGGDEFALSLPDCPPAEAFAVIARMQSATPKGVGSAAGIATTGGEESAEEVIARADAALYRAKRENKNALLATEE
jgi:diguanylate cyclase (GGDEF)-like protein